MICGADLSLLGIMTKQGLIRVHCQEQQPSVWLQGKATTLGPECARRICYCLHTGSAKSGWTIPRIQVQGVHDDDDDDGRFKVCLGPGKDPPD